MGLKSSCMSPHRGLCLLAPPVSLHPVPTGEDRSSHHEPPPSRSLEWAWPCPEDSWQYGVNIIINKFMYL